MVQGIPLTGIIIATSLEAEPFIKALKMREIEDRPFPVYGCDNIFLSISGIGKANAAMATAYMCSKFDPKWIMNLGAAGATQASRELGDIYHIEKVIEPDRPQAQKHPHSISRCYINGVFIKYLFFVLHPFLSFRSGRRDFEPHP